jgi:hypothetical protein
VCDGPPPQARPAAAGAKRAREAPQLAPSLAGNDGAEEQRFLNFLGEQLIGGAWMVDPVEI